MPALQVAHHGPRMTKQPKPKPYTSDKGLSAPNAHEVFERECGKCLARWTMNGVAYYCPKCGAKR